MVPAPDPLQHGPVSLGIHDGAVPGAALPRGEGVAGRGPAAAKERKLEGVLVDALGSHLIAELPQLVLHAHLVAAAVAAGEVGGPDPAVNAAPLACRGRLDHSQRESDILVRILQSVSLVSEGDLQL